MLITYDTILKSEKTFIDIFISFQQFGMIQQNSESNICINFQTIQLYSFLTVIREGTTTIDATYFYATHRKINVTIIFNLNQSAFIHNYGI